MSEKKTRKVGWVSLAILALALILSLIVYSFLPTRFSFVSMEEFSQTWANSSDDERPELLRWLLNAEPKRHTTYQVHQTKLQGMTQSQVEAYLPLGQYDQKHDGGGLTYRLGSIEPDPFGFIVAKQDWLVIDFDEQGVVVRIETIS